MSYRIGPSQPPASAGAIDTMAYAELPLDLPPAASADASKRIRAGAGWVVGARILGVVVTMLLNVELVRLLPPEDFGTFFVLSSVVVFGGSLATLGTNGGIVRFVMEGLGVGNTSQARRVLTWGYWLALFGCAGVGGAVLLVWPTLTVHLRLVDVQDLAWLVALGIGLIAMLQLTTDALRSLDEWRFASLLSSGQMGGLMSNLLFLLVLSAAALVSRLTLRSSLLLNVIVMAVILVLSSLVLWTTARTRLRAPPVSAPAPPGVAMPRLTWQLFLMTCIPLMLVQCVTFTSTQADLWIAGAHCEPDQVSFYAAARRLMLMIVMPLQMVNFLVAGSIAELRAQGRLKDLERLLRRTAGIAALPSLLGLLLVLVAGGPIMHMLFGEFYRAAALPLAILGVGQAVLAWAGPSHCALLMTGNQNKSLLVNGLAALTLVLAGIVSVHFFGIVGLAVTSATVVSLESFVLVLMARRILGVWTHAGLYRDWTQDAKAAWTSLTQRRPRSALIGTRELTSAARATAESPVD